MAESDLSRLTAIVHTEVCIPRVGEIMYIDVHQAMAEMIGQKLAGPKMRLKVDFAQRTVSFTYGEVSWDAIILVSDPGELPGANMIRVQVFSVTIPSTRYPAKGVS